MRLFTKFAAMALVGVISFGAFKWVLAAPSLGAWDSAFENIPAPTDLVSQGPQRFQDLKGRVRDRLETEMEFGEISGVGTDTGRLHEGAARAFVEATAPTVIAVADAADTPIDTLDQGRIWVDTDNDTLWYYDSSWQNLTTAGTETIAIVAGSVTPEASTLIVVQAQTPTTDDLDTIVTTNLPIARTIIVQADSGDTITATAGTGVGTQQGAGRVILTPLIFVRRFSTPKRYVRLGADAP
ncbi:hypothetical protein LCGC14_2672840, partial [marine sediment metagenome]